MTMAANTSPLRRIPAVFMRGGTSNALVFQPRDLPADPAQRDAIFLAALGSPDPGKRQLDGMGGGMSSLSKACVVSVSEQPDADVDYTFAQIPVNGLHVDYSANCGNMSSAIGPFAVEEGLVRVHGDEAVVRIFNTNTNKIIVSRFAVADGLPLVDGDFVNPGVAGTGAPIRLDFVEPGGAATGRLLPTGATQDVLEHPDLPGPVRVSVVDATNAGVFIDAESLGVSASITPDAMEADTVLMGRLDLIRRLAAVKSGLAPDIAAAGRIPGNPKVALVGAPMEYRLTSGDSVNAADCNILVRMVSMGQAHRAIPLTGALCTATAAAIDGTIVNTLARPVDPQNKDAAFAIGHASGILPAVADVERMADGTWIANSAGVFRTARRLMEGNVTVSAARVADLLERSRAEAA